MPTVTRQIPTRRIVAGSRADRGGRRYPLIQLAGQWLRDVGIDEGAALVVTPRRGGFDVRVDPAR